MRYNRKRYNVCFAIMTMVCILIRLEIAPLKDRSPLQDAEGVNVSPPLLGPSLLQLESIVPREAAAPGPITSNLPSRSLAWPQTTQTDKDFRRKAVVKAISAS